MIPIKDKKSPCFGCFADMCGWCEHYHEWAGVGEITDDYIAPKEEKGIEIVKIYSCINCNKEYERNELEELKPLSVYTTWAGVSTGEVSKYQCTCGYEVREDVCVKKLR